MLVAFVSAFHVKAHTARRSLWLRSILLEILLCLETISGDLGVR